MVFSSLILALVLGSPGLPGGNDGNHPARRPLRNGNVRAAAAVGLPDLTVVSVDSTSLDAGVVKMTVKNQGDYRAAQSRIQLQLTWGTNTASFAAAVPALQPAATYIVTLDVQRSVVEAKYCATADYPKKIAESNESNNQLCGQFRGKP